MPAFVIFSDATLRDMARKRPSKLELMKLVTGVGEKKLADFGEAFLDAIKSHCEETGVAIDIFSESVREYGPIVRPKKRGRGAKQPNPLRDEAMNMLREGKSIPFISGATGRADSTIWTYLSQLIADDPTIDVHRWVDAETYNDVLNAAAGMERAAAKPIFEALGERVSYDVIRLVLTHAEAAMNR